MKTKPWQIGVIALGVIGGLGYGAYALLSGNETVNVATVIHVVDVETGELYRINTTKYPTIIPARNPATGKVSMVRVVKDESGEWVVKGRDRETLGSLDEGVVNHAVDAQTGRLTGPVKAPVEFSRPKQPAPPGGEHG